MAPERGHRRPLAIVTGASSGIGRCTAIRLASLGYRTVVIARRAVLLDELAWELSARAPSVAVPMDLRQVERIDGVMHAVLAEHGPASVLVNNAGHGIYRAFAEQSLDTLAELMRVHYEAPVRLIRAVLPGMLARGSGHVFNVSSMSGRVGAWGHAGYAAAKSAMRSVTESLAAEYAPRGVRFTVVYPGIIRTPYFETPEMAPLWARVGHRAIEPERVAEAITDAIGTGRPAVYVPGHYRMLDWLSALSPRLALWMVTRGSVPEEGAAAARVEPAVRV